MAKMVHFTPQAVRRIGHQYKRGGLEGALYERQGRGGEQLLDPSQKQRIIAMVCSQPPAGYALWTVRLGRAGRQAEVGTEGGPGNGSDLVAQPRPEAVAREKCGAWRN